MNIENIDGNFVIKSSISREGLKYNNITEQPFTIYRFITNIKINIVDKSMIGNTFLKKIRWKCIGNEFDVLWGAVGDEQHIKFGACYITAK